MGGPPVSVDTGGAPDPAFHIFEDESGFGSRQTSVIGTAQDSRKFINDSVVFNFLK